MLVDGLTLIDGAIKNANMEQVTVFPTTQLTPGRLVYLTAPIGANPIGMYVYGTSWQLAITPPPVLSIRNSTVGVLAVAAGTARIYPASNITLSSIFASVNTAPVGSSILLDVKKNGVSILGGTPVQILVGSNRSALLQNTAAVLSTDYLTVDITQVGSGTAGSDLAVSIQYS